MEVGEINAAGLLWLCGWDEILVPGADGFGVKGWEETILEKKLTRWAHNGVQNNYRIATER